MKNERLLEEFDIDFIINEENKESEQPFLQLEIPKQYKKNTEHIVEPKRVIIIEL